MIDVLFLAFDDWANTGWRFFKCAQMAGLNVMGFKANIHPFFYPEQLPIHPEIAGFKESPICEIAVGSELSKFMERAKIIHFFASNCIFTEVDFRDKPVVMQHGGRTYRNAYEDLNELYNGFCDASIIQMPDLLGYGANNEHLIYFPVDTDFIKPDFDKVWPEKKLVIGHFPSQPKDKGAERVKSILNSLSHLKDKFEFVTISEKNERMIWLDSLQRMNQCDLIIDVFSDKTSDGLDYGEWGNTSFEAAALGKIVVTMSTHFEKYIEEYGDCALNIANTDDHLRETLVNFIEMDRRELEIEKRKTATWVTAKHSIQATSKKLHAVYKSILKGY